MERHPGCGLEQARCAKIYNTSENELRDQELLEIFRKFQHH